MTPTLFSEVALNQQNNQGIWQLLGSYNFNAGVPYTVSLRDEAPVGQKVLYDAILFAKPDAPLSYFNPMTWTPTLPATGNYEVQAWWPNQTVNASSTVWFDVTTSSGVSRVVKDQTQQTGQWVSLGQFNLDPATAKVALQDYGVTGKRVYADAVRFIPTTSTTTSALYYVHPDHLDTPRQITTSDVANTVVWRWDSEPFGNTLPDQDPDLNSQALSYNLRFPGQYYDAETQLSYNYFRDYNSATGRYIESDPIGLAGGLNTYAYVDGSPVNRSDPSGLVWAGILRGAAAGMKACKKIKACKEAVEKIEKACDEVDCHFERHNAHHPFPGLGWCEHYSLRCFKKGQKNSTIFEMQWPLPGRCVPSKPSGPLPL